MKVVIQRRETSFESGLPSIKIIELELESFRWLPVHKFEYLEKDRNYWETLKDNEDIMGLRL